MSDRGEETAGPSMPDAPMLIAYAIGKDPDVPIVEAPVHRAWMEVTPERFANRCLPLLIANQAGWILPNPATMWLTWDGGRALDAVQIEYEGAAPATCALSHFGQGIVTFNIPYLFRTSPGWNLLVRGPSNCPIDGLYPLEGIVETDWTTSTFTMNWQLTRPGFRAVFPAGEPLCMILPQRRAELEGVQPISRRLEDEPELAGDVARWTQDRQAFLRDLPIPGGEASRRKWQKDYFQGIGNNGRRTDVHQTRLRLRPFRETAPSSEL